MAVVTRFAPSPTGLLHIGGVRTALFSWLYARRMQGQFILRVEDTDLERSTPEAVKVILEGMQWLGLGHDQGPFYQTQRFDRYKEVIASMVKAGTGAYVKIGTSGTGGMGLNIPYTHSEERPSRLVLSKSALAGAHSLLLFLMARTPGGPIVKEIKPAAAIAWKRIGFGEVLRAGRPVPLHDVALEEAEALAPGRAFRPLDPARGQPTGESLKSVFIDTGENGIFSLEEFSAAACLAAFQIPHSRPRRRRTGPPGSCLDRSPWCRRRPCRAV